MKDHIIKILILNEISEFIPIEDALLLKKKDVTLELNTNLLVIQTQNGLVKFPINNKLFQQLLSSFQNDNEYLFLES